jgi:hypothetical protein
MHKASKGIGYSYYAPFVEFLFLTGCRPSEAIGLQWKHVISDYSKYPKIIPNAAAPHSTSSICKSVGVLTRCLVCCFNPSLNMDFYLIIGNRGLPNFMTSSVSAARIGKASPSLLPQESAISEQVANAA